LLLARDGVVHPLLMFIEDEHLASAAAREPGREALAMLKHSLRKVRSHAGVERPVALVRHDVDARGTRHGGSRLATVVARAPHHTRSIGWVPTVLARRAALSNPRCRAPDDWIASPSARNDGDGGRSRFRLRLAVAPPILAIAAVLPQTP